MKNRVIIQQCFSLYIVQRVDSRNYHPSLCLSSSAVTNPPNLFHHKNSQFELKVLNSQVVKIHLAGI